MRTRLYSKPLSVTHGPLARWTVRIAVIIVPTIAAPASGVARPAASSTPPPASEAPAAIALRLPGFRPSWEKNWPVASGPWPPNQPKSFWAP